MFIVTNKRKKSTMQILKKYGYGEIAALKRASPSYLASNFKDVFKFCKGKNL